MRRNAPSAREPRGVPFALVDGRYAIARAQDESTLLRSLGKIWSDSRPGASQDGGDGTLTDPTKRQVRYRRDLGSESACRRERRICL